MTPSREGRDNRNRPKDLPSTSRAGSDRRSVRGSKNNLQELHELYEISSPSRSSSKPSSRPTRKSGSGSSRLANFHIPLLN